MNIIISADFGTSSIKLCCLKNQTCIMDRFPSKFSAEKAIISFLKKHNISEKDIIYIAATGAGSISLTGSILNIPIYKIDEITAIAAGGLYTSHLEEALVVSIGTGTAFVRASKNKIIHLGGSGFGGSTLLNLSSLIFKKDININELLLKGDLTNVDLSIKELYGNEIPSLPDYATAANFGKIKSSAADADIALGLANLLFQTIGVMSSFALKNDSVKTAVVIGATAELSCAKDILKLVEAMFKIKFIIPENPAYVTAKGAYLAVKQMLINKS